MSDATKRPGQIALGWWKQHLRPDDDTGPARALRARLRRAYIIAASNARQTGKTTRRACMMDAVHTRAPGEASATGLARLQTAEAASSPAHMAMATGSSLRSRRPSSRTPVDVRLIGRPPGLAVFRGFSPRCR